MAKKSKTQTCPCGSNRDYAECCARFIDAGQWPLTAEQLMRSRYTAYALKKRDYILSTWHKETAPQDLDLYEDAHVKWVRLNVIRVEQGGEADDTGLVEFEATLKANGRAQKMTELSEFVKQDGHWVYIGPLQAD